MGSWKDRPRHDIPLKTVDWVLEAIGALLVLILLVLPLYFSDQLPDQIPVHYNAAGEPDDYDSKSSLWQLPLITILLYGGMAAIGRYPHLFNYLEEITEENAKHKYSRMTRAMRIMRIYLAALFLFIQIMSISTALGHSEGLGKYFIIVIMGASALSTPLLVYFLSSSNKKT